MLFSAVKEERILKYDPNSGSVSEFRRYTGRTNGIAIGPNGSVYGAQEGGRRVIEFKPDGTTVQTSDQLDGLYHNQPTDLAVDAKGRVWIADAFNTTPPYGPPIYPFLDHASVLRLERGAKNAWTLTRVTTDTNGVRAIALSPDDKTLYVAEGDADRGAGPRELRAYPVQADGSLGKPRALLELGTSDRGIEGICVDSEGAVIAAGGSAKSGPGAMIYVFSPAGELVEKHAAPADMPIRVAFGDADMSSLYLTTEGGHLYRAKDAGRKGVRR
jgi:gluconolactonase